MKENSSSKNPIKRLYNFFKSFDYRLKFLMVGGLNTLVGVGSYWLILIIAGVDITSHYNGVTIVIIATIISQLLGITNSYFWNKFFTFESKKKSKSETAKFLLVYGISFCTDYFLKIFLRRTFAFNDIIIAIFTTLVTMVISFTGQKFFVFRYKNNKKLAQTQQSNTVENSENNFESSNNDMNQKNSSNETKKENINQ